MLKPRDLTERFPDAVKLADDFYRLKDVVPAFTYHYYVWLAEKTSSGKDLLAVSETRYDDDFASHILRSLAREAIADELQIRELAPYGKYKFNALLTAPPDYHSYFKGRLDAERKQLFFCCPIYRYEFGGNETSEEFYALRRDIVPTLDWQREPAPKIVLRFDNPKTGGGTVKRRRIFAKRELLLQEIDKLSGVENGFIEIGNYRGNTAEIRSAKRDVYKLRLDGKEEAPLGKEQVRERVGQFLTG
jgi:hypothetical protein